MAQNRSANPQAETEAAEQIHEKTDLRFIVLLVFVALIGAAAFVTHGSLWWWLYSLPGYARRATSASWQVISPHAPPPARYFPALQLNPPGDLQDFLQAQHQALHSYGWSEPASNRVHIPIQRAMALIAQEGLPPFRPAAPTESESESASPPPKAQENTPKPKPTGPAAPWPNPQDDPPGSNQPAAGQPAPSGSGKPGSTETNSSSKSQDTSLDNAFVREVAQAGVADLQLGQLGQQKAQSSQLHDLSRHLAHEAKDTNKRAQDVARDQGLTLSHAAGLKDQLALKRLSQQHGSAFDQELARQFLADHAALYAETQAVLDKLQVPEVKDLAKHVMDTLQEDIADIRDAAKAVGLSAGTIQAVEQRQENAATAPSNSGAWQSSPPAASESQPQGGGGQQGQGSQSGQGQSPRPQGQSPPGQESSPASTNQAPSPLQLQQQRAHRGAPQNQQESP